MENKARQSSTLSRRFTPFTLLMLSINGMMGSAWLFAPLYAARIAGTGSLIAWLIGGGITVVIALSFAELSVLFPVAGGTAYIPNISHGTLTSFILSWIAWLSALTMAPIEVLAILQYASNYFTSLTHVVDGAPLLTLTGFFWATILMLVFCILNVLSYKMLIRSNSGLFFFKAGIVVLTIIFFIKTRFYPQNFSGFVQTATTFSGWQAILTAVATGGIAFAFTGFKHGVELAGEAKRASLAIPMAIVGSVGICLALYIGLQVGFIGALLPSSVANSWAHLKFAGDIGPFAGLAGVLGLFWLAKLLYIDAAISPAGAGLIYVTSTARILYAMSKMGYLPESIAKLNRQGFPIMAIAINFCIGMLLFLPLPGWQAMVSFLVSGMVLSYAMGPIALWCLRLELPNKERRFRLPAAQFLCPLAFYFCNLLTYWTGWETIHRLAIAMLIGLIVFVIACYKGKLAVKKTEKTFNFGIKSAIWLFPYLPGLVLISYLGAFGGKNIIPFGWDFLVIGLFSVMIFFLAVKCRVRLTTENIALTKEIIELSTP